MLAAKVGYNSGAISASYAAGTVTGGDNVGGLVGYNYREGAISASYAAGTVTGDVKMLAAWWVITDSYYSRTISASYYDSKTSGLSVAVGLDDDYGTAPGRDCLREGNRRRRQDHRRASRTPLRYSWHLQSAGT